MKYPRLFRLLLGFIVLPVFTLPAVANAYVTAPEKFVAFYMLGKNDFSEAEDKFNENKSLLIMAGSQFADLSYIDELLSHYLISPAPTIEGINFLLEYGADTNYLQEFENFGNEVKYKSPVIDAVLGYVYKHQGILYNQISPITIEKRIQILSHLFDVGAECQTPNVMRASLSIDVRFYKALVELGCDPNPVFDDEESLIQKLRKDNEKESEFLKTIQLKRQ